MNYQQPLLNLVTKGHLNVKNPIGTQKFIEGLDNDSCKTILENLLFRKDASECARILDEAKETFELATNTRLFVSESTLNNARDKILTEDVDDTPFDTLEKGVKDDVSSILKMIKYGTPIAAAMYLARIPEKERDNILKQVKLRNSKVYDFIMSSPVFKKVLPPDYGFFQRGANAMWKLDFSNVKNSPTLLNASDKNYIKGIGTAVGNGALIAAGIVTGLIAINVLYKQVFSYEAKKCKGLIGKKRTICMCSAILEGSERAKKKSEELLLKCDSAKDPQDCRYKMKVEIRSWMRKIEEQKRKLAKLQAVNKTAYPVERPKQVESVPVNSASDPFGADASNIVSEPVKVQTPKAPAKNDPFAKTAALTNPFA